MKSCILGIDGGGTKTICAVSTLDGEVIGMGQSGTTNPNLASETEVKDALQKAICEAIGNHRELSIEFVCAGMAGTGTVENQILINKLIRQILDLSTLRSLLNSRFNPSRNIYVCLDTVITLVAGAGVRHGLVAISGTGSIIYGETINGQNVRVGGWGNLLDEGSGYEIGRLALQAVMKFYDGGANPSLLTQMVLDTCGLDSPDKLTYYIYRKDLSPSSIADLARAVNQAAIKGDIAARNILEKIADELYDSILVAAKRLDFKNNDATLVLSGGVLTNIEIVRERIAKKVMENISAIKTIELCREPVKGAIRIALEKNVGCIKKNVPKKQTKFF